MATSPSRVRAALVAVAAAGAAEVSSLAQRSNDPMALLMETLPGTVDYYRGASSALALDWYDELREESGSSGSFVPEPAESPDAAVMRGGLANIAAEVEVELAGLTLGVGTLIAVRAALMTEGFIASGFSDTILTNTKRDRAAGGWRRYARPSACQFCRMLADRGAVYSEATARFAAHGAVTGGKKTGGQCMCIAGPAFKSEKALRGGDMAEASAMQYTASRTSRTPKQRATLRAYLNQNFPEVRG